MWLEEIECFVDGSRRVVVVVVGRIFCGENVGLSVHGGVKTGEEKRESCGKGQWRSVKSRGVWVGSNPHTIIKYWNWKLHIALQRVKC
jgi:hypothetical protein